jgi:hypothetical protein
MDLLVSDSSVPWADADQPPVGGTPQYATDGNPAADPPVPGTVWPAYWFNTLLKELLAILTAAGVTPDRTVTNQLLTALQDLFDSKLTSGVLTLPGGYIFMITTYSISVGSAGSPVAGLNVGSADVTYPATFPTGCLNIQATPGVNVNSAVASAQAVNNGNNKCHLYVSDSTTSGIAIGWILAFGQ